MSHSNEDAIMIPADHHLTVQHFSDASHIIMQHVGIAISLNKERRHIGYLKWV